MLSVPSAFATVIVPLPEVTVGPAQKNVSTPVTVVPSGVPMDCARSLVVCSLNEKMPVVELYAYELNAIPKYWPCVPPTSWARVVTPRLTPFLVPRCGRTRAGRPRGAVHETTWV